MRADVSFKHPQTSANIRIWVGAVRMFAELCGS